MLDLVFRAWIKSREGFIHPIVKKKLKVLLADHPNLSKVWLTGSFLRGDWLTEESSEWEKDLKYRISGKQKLSDVDFITLPIVDKTEDYDIIHDSKHKLLIYDNGKSII